MEEKKLKLEIPLLIPGVNDKQDRCLDRLEGAVRNIKGIQRAHIDREKKPLIFCLHYDPSLVTIENVQHLAEQAGVKIAHRYHHDVIPVEGMDCSDCSLVVEHGLSRMEGVLDVKVSYAAQTAHVEYDSQQVNRGAIEQRIHQLGYAVPAGGMHKWYAENRELLMSLIAGLFLLAGWLGARLFHFPFPLSLGFYLLAYLSGGWNITRHAFSALKERRFDTDLLMVVAALGALLLRDFAEGALLLFLFSLGHALEERALDRARNAIHALADLTPRTALARQDGQETEVPVDSLGLNTVVVVRPGTRLPVDGIILHGKSALDQSPVTGESIPVDKKEGDKVFAGTLNGEGALDIKVTRLAKDSTLARVTRMVEQAQAQKSPTQQITERFMRWFVPAVLIGDGLLFLISLLFGVSAQTSFLRAMTLLVAASPCALALGTPSAILSGIARAAHNGVLLKGGIHLENLGRLRLVAFDKTGTITQGKPSVTDVISTNHLNENEVLALAAAVESRSAHPLAKAVVSAAHDRKLLLPEALEVTATTGLGVQARSGGKMIRVGNLKLLQESRIPLSTEIQEQVQNLGTQGKTVMVVMHGRETVGIIAVADIPRPDAKTAIARLRQMGVEKAVLLTGDNERAARHIADQVGFSDYRANLMPEDKLAAIQALVREQQWVAMVGDGVNDAPALAHATVSIAMGGAGTDVALETADVALMADDLSKLPFAVGLGRATRAIIQQNLVISLGVIVCLMIASITGLSGIGGTIVFHEGSTLLVALNALRLLGYNPPPYRN
ncbi:MAG: heavy metal translocating P-type ATPase [Omnitrophica WOR_2 bacterium]